MTGVVSIFANFLFTHLLSLCLVSAAAFSSCQLRFFPSPSNDGVQAEDNESFKTMVQFECRGLEPIDFQPQVRIYETLTKCVA